ncbi:MAG: hypothetical protein NWT00_06275 [Beijerinckiaceae bacterium]|nr:hypothetical protein [Beijerinckiaceae bacterium]
MMAILFALLIHIETLSGAIALGAALAYLIAAGKRRPVNAARIAAALGGFAAYLACARFVYGARDYFWALSTSPGFAGALFMMLLAIAAGVVTGGFVVRAVHSEWQRLTAIIVCAFVAGFYLHGYQYVWSLGMSAHIIPMLPFILFTGSSVITGMLTLYVRARKLK